MNLLFMYSVLQKYKWYHRSCLYLILLSAFIVLPFAGATAQKDVPVFISGQDGHQSYRIPAIVSMPDGRLIAFAEGRVHHAGDFGDVNIVMKTSNDRGFTWSAMKIIADFDTLQAGNPAPVVDLMDPAYPQGRIFLFYNTGNNHEYDVRKGKGLREVWYITSVDGGNSWSQPVNITTQTHRPKMPAINPAYNFKEDWRCNFNTPGHAMQFKKGKYKGRIYIAANHSEGDPKPDATDYKAHGYFTDDHGKTFRLSENIPLDGSNENTAAEISGGRLMLNMRNQRGDIRARYIALSKNGGQSWYKSYFDKNLPDPVCEGTILTIGKHLGRNRLAFCNAADTSQRNNLTLRISRNNGKSWYKHFTVYRRSGAGDHAAYSDIVKIDKRRIGVFYEKDNYSTIVFTTVKWK